MGRHFKGTRKFYHEPKRIKLSLRVECYISNLQVQQIVYCTLDIFFKNQESGCASKPHCGLAVT